MGDGVVLRWGVTLTVRVVIHGSSGYVMFGQVAWGSGCYPVRCLRQPGQINVGDMEDTLQVGIGTSKIGERQVR